MPSLYTCVCFNFLLPPSPHSLLIGLSENFISSIFSEDSVDICWHPPPTHWVAFCPFILVQSWWTASSHGVTPRSLCAFPTSPRSCAAWIHWHAEVWRPERVVTNVLFPLRSHFTVNVSGSRVHMFSLRSCQHVCKLISNFTNCNIPVTALFIFHIG